jgi:hypothetical protein
VSDGTATSTGHVYVTINSVNDAPTVTSQSLATNEDTPLSITLTAADIDNSPLYMSFMVFSPPTHGTLSGTGANLVYTPHPNYNGPDSFTFVVYDGKAQSATATVSINVAAVNDAPVAVANIASVVRNSSAVNIAVLSNDSDVDGDALTITSVTQSSNGTVTIAPGGKSVNYKPRQNYRGNDVFSYTINDGRGGIATAVVTVTVK